ncbi:hypothetical protein RHO15_03245 [Utexia brackfieldae]|uniref:hypothetical protein n=1 Tax=Utexia brackfieldae TaxID=3074108 RepID=UPI00370DB665
MQKPFFIKHLIIPVILFLVYKIIIMGLSIYQSYGTNINLTALDIIDDMLIYAPGQILFIIIPSLIFCITYQLTRLTLKNIVYIVCTALALVLIDQLTPLFMRFIAMSDLSLAVKIYLIPPLYYLINIINIFIVGLISYIFVRMNHLTCSMMSHKLLCALYSCLFISMIMTYQYPIIISFLRNFTLDMTMVTSFMLVMLISIYLLYVYCYSWSINFAQTKTLAAHYPLKTIVAFTLPLLITMIISCVLTVIVLALLSSIQSWQQAQFIIIPVIIVSYLLAIFLFIQLLRASRLKVYKITHCVLYIISTLVFIFYFANLPSYFSGAQFITFICYAYGLIMFALSLSLYIFYVANKLSLKIVFKPSQSI